MVKQRKIYSAFISSVYESLRDERNEVIDCLLDYNVFPICMEHFTAATNKQFKDIEDRIDDADFFILILGASYGSYDENGVSWTEREYLYAKKTCKPMIAIFCDELIALRNKRNDGSLSEEEQKQLEFSDKIHFARSVTDEISIRKIIAQFFSGYDFSMCDGWVRVSRFNEVALAQWRDVHKAWDLGGEWFHVHLSPEDHKYIRTGTIHITQNFTPEEFRKLEFDGLNYSVNYDPISGELYENKLKRTHWNGDYKVDGKGYMFGVFEAKREFTGNFGEYIVDKGIRRGIHDFSLKIKNNYPIDFFEGEFHDEAPSPKFGVIYVFRQRENLINYLKDNFMEILENNLKGVN